MKTTTHCSFGKIYAIAACFVMLLAPATVVIGQAPTIVEQPVGQSVVVGQDATFTITVAGSPMPTLQWQSSTNNSSTWANISGATDAMLTLTSVTTDMNFTVYRCIATNSQGTAISSIAMLSVGSAYPPYFMKQPVSQSASIGQDVTFTVGSANGNPNPAVQWQSSSDGSTWANTSNATGATLTLTSVTIDMNGTQYRCVATNSQGTAISNIAMLVVDAVLATPTIITQPASQSIIAGQNAAFSITAAGNPAPTFQWQSAPNAGGAWTNISGATTATLTLNAVTAAMSGMQYRCVVSNSVNSLTSNAATLGVGVLGKIAAGGWHSLYITNDGNLWAMGANNRGQLGVSGTADRHIPVQVTAHGTAKVIAVAAGGNHSLYVTSDGQLWAMGYMGFDDIDFGISERFTPELVATNVTTVAAGDYHCLFVTKDGQLWAMGINTDGQLGIPSKIDGQLGMDAYNSSNKPVRVPGATNVVAVAAAQIHSLYVTSDGKLYAMGNNGGGQLGDGTTASRSTPRQVWAGNSVVAIAAGSGFSVFVTGDKQLWSVGINYFKSWNITQSYDVTSVQVPNASNVVALAAGSNHILYETGDGKLWAAGLNGYGELGDGTTTNRSPQVQVPNASNVVSISAGKYHSLFVTSDSKLWAMGDNTNGQLGIGDITNRLTPVLVADLSSDSSTAPTITNVSTTTAKVGDTITITGTNLTGATVTIGGQPATIVSNDGTTLKVTVPATTTSGTIVIKTAAGSVTATQTITITPPVTPSLSVDKITLALAQPAASTAPFTITSNIAWTTRIDPATATWLAVITATGNGTTPNAAITISANTTGTPRTAYIVVNGNDINPSTLIATQAATTATPNPAPATLATGATLTLNATSPTPPVNRTLAITTSNATGGTLTYTDATGTHTCPYEYNATGATGTLVIEALDSTCSLKFTNATTGTLALYTTDATGNPLDLTGAFTYAPPAASTYSLSLNYATATPSGSGPYAAGTTITIKANDAPAGQAFDHWTSTPAVAFANPNATTTTFTMPATATTVTAIYKTQTTGGGGNNNGGNSGGSGGGGGGAPSLLWLGAVVALVGARASCPRMKS